MTALGRDQSGAVTKTYDAQQLLRCHAGRDHERALQRPLGYIERFSKRCYRQQTVGSFDQANRPQYQLITALRVEPLDEIHVEDLRTRIARVTQTLSE